MSRINLKIHNELVKEARRQLKEVKPLEETNFEIQTGAVVLTQDHLLEWLEVFEEDRIKLDGCNQATVKR